LFHITPAKLAAVRSKTKLLSW